MMSKMYYINLDLIDPNPWQPRQIFDEAGIAELAADILSRSGSRAGTKGLLQLPTVRIAKQDGDWDIPDNPETTGSSRDISNWMERCDYRAQLAFGHRRFAAFMQLVEQEMDRPDFQSMPVEVVQFTDEEMATAAWSENSARKNLTAIEEARAIRSMMKSFKWKQKEAAEKLNMARATLANRLRLLKLPKSIQDEQLEGNLSERKALALLPIYELSKPLRDKAEERTWNSPTKIVEDALSGESDSDEIREGIRYMLSGITSDLSEAKFPLDHEFKPQKVIVSPACDNCRSRIRRGQVMLCTVEDCYYKKGELWGKILLRKASKEFGIPVLKKSEGEWNENEDFYSYNEPKAKAGKLIIAEGCSKGNLRLNYLPHGGGSLKLGKGYPGITVVCHRGEGKQCSCLQTHMPAAEAEVSGISVEDYTEDRKAAKERTRRVEEEIRAPAAEGLVVLLEEGSVDVWRMLADIMVDQVNVNQKDTSTLKDLNAVQDYIARSMIDYAMPWNPEKNLELTAKDVCFYLEEGANLQIDGLQPENFKEPEAEESTIEMD